MRILTLIKDVIKYFFTNTYTLSLPVKYLEKENKISRNPKTELGSCKH